MDYCSQLCSVLSQAQIAGGHWGEGREEDLPSSQGGPLRLLQLDSGSLLQLCLLLLQTTSLQPRKAKPAKTSHSHPSIALPTPQTRTTTLSQSTGPSKAHPKVTAPWPAPKPSHFLGENPVLSWI